MASNGLSNDIVTTFKQSDLKDRADLCRTDSDDSFEMGQRLDKLVPGDFEPVQLIGIGSFGQVYLVRKRTSGLLFAMKVLSKEDLISNNLVKYAQTERNVLSYVEHPFIVNLNYAFQTKHKLYLILEYCAGGDLSQVLKIEKRFSIERTRLYAAEILLAIESLHRRDIIFRDLKPDNVVIDAEGHIKLTDFGLSKEGITEGHKARSFCGSLAYLAPEVLTRIGHGKSLDWYLFGVLIYEMLIGDPPYYSKNENELLNNILTAKLRLPNFLPKSV